jgi:hypothetical protein
MVLVLCCQRCEQLPLGQFGLALPFFSSLLLFTSLPGSFWTYLLLYFQMYKKYRVQLKSKSSFNLNVCFFGLSNKPKPFFADFSQAFA